MDAEGRVRYLREKMKLQLQQWMPNNDALVQKELHIFDRIMSRREFLQTTSIVAATALFYGCSNGNDIKNLPSNIDDDSPISDTEQSSVTKATKLLVDADILDSYDFYNPLGAKGSSDAPTLKGHTVIESFNPHLMTLDSSQDSDLSGFKELTRNYGISEIVHLNKESSTSNYTLSIFEKDINSSQQALTETLVELPTTQDLNFNNLVAANGNYHNRVKDAKVYAQKMLLMVNDETLNPDIRIYYQSNSSPLLNAGVATPTNKQWQYLDIVSLFKEYDTNYSFTNYKLIDVNSYEDGSNNNFIYGTLQFDDFYNYGFTISYSNIDDTAPTISFFTPKFLSKNASTIETLKNDFDALGIESTVELKEFALFSSQKFIPFVHLKDSTLFSFFSFDTSVDEDGGEIYSDDGYEFDLTHFTQSDISMIKHYLIDVDTTKSGISYLLEEYSTDASISLDGNFFEFTFDTSNIPTLDLWSLYKKENDVANSMASLQLRDSFIRFVKDDDNTVHVMFVSSILTTQDIGISHSSIKIEYETKNSEKSNFKVLESLTSKSFVDESSFDNYEYKSMWYENMKNSSIHSSLSDCVHGDNGYYDFYSTHNHQGVLKNYFVIKVGDYQFLLNFNEQGMNPEPTQEQQYNFQTHDNLYENIKNDTVAHFPPLPVSTNVKNLLKWRSVGSDEEVLYTAVRPYDINKEEKSLVENKNKALHSYFFASLDPLDSAWNTHEINKNCSYNTKEQNLYKIQKHQVHIHTNNIYDIPTEVEENIYVEVRFASAVVVTDQSDTTSPKTYHARRDTSLFLKPVAGTITLEVSSGFTHDDLFNGATMFYRYVDKNEMIMNQEQPTAILSDDATQTTEFMKCNISFRQFERLSTQNINRYQIGMREDDLSDAQTADDILQANVKSSQKENISKVTDLYQTLYENAAPQNQLAPASITSAPMIVNPLFYTLSAISKAPLRSTNYSASFRKWGHKALSTIESSAKHAEEELIKVVKETLEKLVDDIEDLINDSSQSMQTMLTSLMVLLNKMIELATARLILYLAPFWLFVRGYIGLNPAWDIGRELKQLKSDQFSQTSTVEGNVYSIIKEQTKKVEEKIDEISDEFQKKVDGAIDSGINTISDSFDANFEKSKSVKNHQQKNSTKQNHLLHQTARVHHRMALSDPKDTLDTDESVFVCGENSTVEELIACLSKQELEDFKDDYYKKGKDSQKLLQDMIDGKNFDTYKEDLSSFLKDNAHSIEKEFSTLTKGIVQVPLAFLNGSSSINFAENILEGVLKELFQALGLILFKDIDKFKTIEDIGYFFTGFHLYMSLSFFKDIDTFTTTKSIDVVKYIQSGEFREKINDSGSKKQASSLHKANEKEENFEELVEISELIDGILVLTIHTLDLISEKSPPTLFIIIKKIIIPTEIFARFITRGVIVKKHETVPKKEGENEGWYTFYIIMSELVDIFHYITLIIQMIRQYVFKYEYILSGSSDGYKLLTVAQGLILEIKNLLALIVVSSLEFTLNHEKRGAQISKKFTELLSTSFVTIELLWETSSDENEEDILYKIAITGAFIFESLVLLETYSYMNSKKE